jgi:hypothetical protein
MLSSVGRAFARRPCGPTRTTALNVFSSKLRVSAVSARTTDCSFTGSDTTPMARGLSTNSSRRRVLPANSPTGRKPRPKSGQRQDRCPPVRRSRGTSPVRRSRGTPPVRRSRGTGPVRRSRGTSPVRRSRGTSPVRRSSLTPRPRPARYRRPAPDRRDRSRQTSTQVVAITTTPRVMVVTVFLCEQERLAHRNVR